MERGLFGQATVAPNGAGAAREAAALAAVLPLSRGDMSLAGSHVVSVGKGIHGAGGGAHRCGRDIRRCVCCRGPDDRQPKRPPEGREEPAFVVDQKTDCRSGKSAGLQRPGLEWVERRALEGENGPSSNVLSDPIENAQRPTVHWVWLTILVFSALFESRPECRLIRADQAKRTTVHRTMTQAGQVMRCKGAGEVIFSHAAKSSSLGRGGKPKLVDTGPRPWDRAKFIGFKGDACFRAAVDPR